MCFGLGLETRSLLLPFRLCVRFYGMGYGLWVAPLPENDEINWTYPSNISNNDTQ